MISRTLKNIIRMDLRIGAFNGISNSELEEVIVTQLNTITGAVRDSNTTLISTVGKGFTTPKFGWNTLCSALVLRFGASSLEKKEEVDLRSNTWLRLASSRYLLKDIISFT